MHRIRELREEKGLTQVRLAVSADMNPATLNRIEMGKANPNLKTLERLADALGITVSRLLEDDSPKGLEPPLPFSSEPSEAERRLTQAPEVLGAYILGRMERHEADLYADDSPHFRTATSATLWLAGVEEEASFWTDWALEQAVKIMPVPRTGSQILDGIGAFVDGLEVMGFMLSFVGLKNRAEERIKSMNDTPDEIAALRLAKADAAVDEARARLEDLRTAHEA
jgi:transcriptional regulator with XRE-family HTH domain